MAVFSRNSQSHDVEPVFDENKHRHISERLSHEVPINTGWTTTQQIVFEPEIKGRIYVDRGILCIEHLAKLPLQHCIKTNEKADRIIRIHLRSPYNPATWWGKQSRRLTLGLSQKAWHRYKMITLNSWLLISFAALSLCFSMVSPLFILTSALLFLGGSVLRSIAPVRVVKASREFTSVKGVCPAFGAQFDQYDKGEPLN